MKIKIKKILSMCFAIVLILSMTLTTQIQASATEINATETSEQTVTEDTQETTKYGIYFTETKHGTVEIKDNGTTEYEAGEKVYLTLTPDDGYFVTEVGIVDENGAYLSWLDANDNPCNYEDITNTISFEMPESNVTVSIKYGNGTDTSENISADDIQLSADMVMRSLGADTPDAIALASIDDQIATCNVGVNQNITIRRAVAEDRNSCFNTYVNGTFDTTESILLAEDAAKTWVFCAEPRINVGTLNPPVTFNYMGNVSTLMGNLYGWSVEKTNKVSMAMRVASSKFSHWECNYCLMQNVLWSQIKWGEGGNSNNQCGVYTLTNTGKYTCPDLSTKGALDNAINAVWNTVNEYRKMPSYNHKVIRNVTPGQDYKIQDTNNVSNQLNIDNAAAGYGVSYSVEASGITIHGTAGLAGKSVTFYFNKKDNKGINFGANAFLYQKDSRQKISVWDSALSKMYGSVTVEFANTKDSYMTAHYKARDKVSPSLDLYINKSDADTGAVLAGAEFQVYMDNKLVKTVTTDKNGQAVYHWRENVIWTDYYESYKKLSSFEQWGSKYKEAKNEVLNQINTKLAEIKSQKHTWKVIETKAPQDYEINEIVWEQEIDLDTHAVEVSFTDISQGFLNMNKVSADATLVKDNPCYSLEGAVYGVYDSIEDAKADQNRVEILTTDKNGNSNTVTLHKGIYYVKELTASKGYELCREDENLGQGNEGIHKVKVKPKETTSFTCKEVPGNDPFALTLQKMDKETGKAEAPGDTSLGGAIFELAYYTNTDGDTSGTPFKKWYFQTDDTGYFICSMPKYLINSHTMEDGTVYTSDKLFINSDGEVQYPVGTYTFKEVSAPLYFQKVGYMNFQKNVNDKADVTTGLKAIIKQDANGNAAKIYDGNNVVDGWIDASNLSVNAYDEKQPGSITLYKKTSDGTKKPLAGVTFKMVGLTTNDEYEATTDEDGKITWGDLVAQKYVITEVKTVDGMNLLKDNITVTMPMEMTLDEIRANNADINQAVFDEVSGKYCFYDITFTIDNSITFNMPITGGNQTVMYIVLIAGLAAVAGGIWFIMCKKK